METVAEDCQCEDCRGACEYKPGWFMPDQIPKLLEHFKASSVQELVDDHDFAIDYYEAYPNDIDILAPNTVKNKGWPRYPENPKGTCVFLQDGKCSIHDVKPYECREFVHEDSNDDISDRHRAVAKQWEDSDLLKDVERY